MFDRFAAHATREQRPVSLKESLSLKCSTTWEWSQQGVEAPRWGLSKHRIRMDPVTVPPKSKH